MNTPHLPTRKILLDLLLFLVYWNDGEGHPLVVAAFEALSAANNEGSGCFEYWFKSLDAALSGRGKMCSLVGASEEVRRGGVDSSLNDYAVCGSCDNDYRIISEVICLLDNQFTHGQRDTLFHG